MINTIFYFPESLTFDQYTNLLDSDTDEGIARRTIVFARQQGKIYNNGKLYGTTASDVQPLIDETKEYLEGLIDDTKVDFDSLIERIKASLNGVRNDLDNVLSRESDGINQMIEDVINSKGFIDGWQAGWDNNINAYLIQAGIIDANNNKGWAYLETKYNELKAEVNSINIGDGLTTEIVRSLIDARIEENSSIVELKSRYALTNEDKTVLKWLSAGLYSEANANESLTSVFASAESVATNTSAISGLTTRVSSLENEDFLTESSLVSEIRKNKGDISTVLSEAGLVNTAKLNEATSTLASRLDGVETTSGDNVDAISALLVSVKNLEDNGAPATETSVISAINVHKNDIVTTLSSAGLVNTATLDSAKSTLQTNIDNVSSRIVSKSEIEDTVETATAGMVVESDLDDYVAKASIIASINSSGESNVTIDADKIDVGGIRIEANNITGIGDLVADQIDSALINAENITSGTLNADRLNISQIVGKLVDDSTQMLILANNLDVDADSLYVTTASGVVMADINATNNNRPRVHFMDGLFQMDYADYNPDGTPHSGTDAYFLVWNTGGTKQGVLGCGTLTFQNGSGSIFGGCGATEEYNFSIFGGLWGSHTSSLDLYNWEEDHLGCDGWVNGHTTGGTSHIGMGWHGDIYTQKLVATNSIPWGDTDVSFDNVNTTTIDGTSIKVNQPVEGLSDQYVEIEPNNILFGHTNGDVCNVNLKSDGLNFDSLIVASGFATTNGTGSILLDNGNTMTLAELKAALNAI